jgi:hypothetical protein
MKPLAVLTPLATLSFIHSAAMAMTQDEAFQAIRQNVGNGGGDANFGPYAWMALTALVLSLALLFLRWRRTQRSRKPTLNDPAKLAREMRREAGLSRADLRQLRRDAGRFEKQSGTQVPDPLVMALCPSLKGKRAT